MKQRILIADDDEAVRRILGQVLEAEHYDVVFARDGLQALSEFLIIPYDLLLLDLRMPGKDGWEVYEVISRLHPMMPIIIMTALPDQREHADRAGVDAFFEKPLDLGILLQSIRVVLAHPRPLRQMSHSHTIRPRSTAVPELITKEHRS